MSLADLVQSEATPTAQNQDAQTGTVTWIGPKSALVNGQSAELNGHRVAVGDEVSFTSNAEHLQITAIRPRKTYLSRPDVGNAHLERVIVANVDVVGIVVSVVSPPLHPRLIDRYLVAIQLGGAEPVIIINKCDLLPEDALAEELQKVAPYASLDVPLYACSTQTGKGLKELSECLAGKTCAFVGHSGVGKSSLANGLFPELELKTGELIRGYGRGTHTTTSSSMFQVGNGTRLIDTPGIRSFGLGKMTREQLQAAFPEFEGQACRFRDCSHLHEPHCGVQTAAREGTIHPARYETYRRLAAEVLG